MSDEEDTDDVTTKKFPQKNPLWDSDTEDEDSDERNSSVIAPHIERLDSQQSSVSFRSECSDSEQSIAAGSRKRPKKFSILLKTVEGKFGIAVEASDIEMFIKKVKDKFYSKVKGRNIDCLLLEHENEHVLLEEDNLEFEFLRSSNTITIQVESSPIKSKVNPFEHKIVSVTTVNRDDMVDDDHIRYMDMIIIIDICSRLYMHLTASYCM